MVMEKLITNFLSLSLFMAFWVATSDPILSCRQTPYPHACDSMIRASALLAPIKTPSEFRNLVLNETMKLAVRAHDHALAMDTSSLNEKAKVAWADCLELSEDTINQLNRTIGSSSYGDSQTWLSAAMTNVQTCCSGFEELGSSFHLGSPFTSYNISELICNMLAINKAKEPYISRGNRPSLSNGIPKWMSLADRKLLWSSAIDADLVVAKDGSGDYATISEAITAAKHNRDDTKRFVIYVKAGIYDETTIKTKMKNLMIIGEGINATIITGNKSVEDGVTTSRTATFAITGEGFIARNVTFQNTAGPDKQQAVAFLSKSDRSVLHQCSFEGYQDTLYVFSRRQFYHDCDIYGTVDFIFGNAVALFQNCNLYVRKRTKGNKNVVTAQGRSNENENTGISICNSVVTAAPDLKPVQDSFETYLGRPWKQYSRTVFMNTSLDSLINPAGWLEWNGNKSNLGTLYYGEYMNTGPGANTSDRVNWPGFHIITSASDANNFTARDFLSGDLWIPATGVPYTPDL